MMSFCLHHLRLTLACPAGPLRTAITDVLCYKGALPIDEHAVPAASDAADIQMTFSTRPAPFAVPLGARFITSHDCGLAIYTDGGCSFLVQGHAWAGRGALAVVDPRAALVTTWLGADYQGPLNAEQHALVGHLTTLPLSLLLAHQAHYALQATALVRQNHGLLLTAADSQVKTAATRSLVQSGWSFLSDDTILLHRDSAGGVSVTAYRHGLTAGPVARIPELATPAWPPVPGRSGRLHVDLDQVYSDRFCTSMRPSVLLFAECTDMPSRLAPMPRRAALDSLVPQSVVFASADAAVQRGYAEVLRTLTRQCQAYHLLAGPDLLEDRGQLDTLLVGAPCNAS